MQRTSRSGERRESPDVEDLSRDFGAMAPACGTGSDSSLDIWKRRERARTVLNARSVFNARERRARIEHEFGPESDRPSG